MTVEEQAYLKGWGKNACLLSVLPEKLAHDPFQRLVEADLAAGETDVLTFTATRCAKGCSSGYFFVLDGDDGWFLGLEGPALSDAEVVNSVPTPADMSRSGAEMFPARVEVIRAPKSGLIHSVRMFLDSLCPVERVLEVGRLNWESVLFKSSWQALEEDVRSLLDAPLATVDS
jgi:hypothetical protein